MVSAKEKIADIPLPATNYGQHRPKKLPLWRAVAASALVFGFLATLRSYNIHTDVNDLFGHEHRIRHVKGKESLFLSVPNAESALKASRAYATHPHLGGATEDFEDAKVILKLFQDEFGIPALPEEPIFKAGSEESRNATLRLTDRGVKPSAWIDTYFPVLNTPLDRSLEILGEDGNVIWAADLAEDGDALDEDAHRYKDSVPTFHGLSKNGTAEGQLIYANYGTKEDYDELENAGTDFKGKIVITRYGAVFRGLKIKRAQELGAAGVLIYSDPRDDGYVTVENGFAPYPAGPARNPTSVQRGSVQFLSLYPGDPTTPGKPAYEDSEREEGVNIPTIPSLPISWQNAQRLLEAIGNIYDVDEAGNRRLSGGASTLKVKLVNHVDTKVTPIWNTMASIPGHIRNEVVIIGCHRDAWVLGAADPTSGTVSLHEIIRGFGALLRSGWRPLRTVLFASWDAEEYGLIGSTEWGEDFPDWIQAHAAAYLNVDVSVSGSRWHVSGSPSLADLIKRTALDIPHPTESGKTLWDARDDVGPFTPASSLLPPNATIDAEYLNRYRAETTVAGKIGALGSGSDYTVFLQRLGVASTDQGFGVTPSDAPYHYHSIYDSQRWQEVYADPDFSRHVAVAQHLGLMALRTIDSVILPLNTTAYSYELESYLSKVQALAKAFKLANEDDLELDFAGLEHAISRVQSASKKLDKEKLAAKKHLKKIFKQLPRLGCGHCKKPSRIMRKLRDFVKRVFGVTPHNYQHFERDEALALLDWLEFDGDEIVPSARLQALEEKSHRKPFPIRKFIKAAMRVKAANDKLMAFERGFISEDGINDREWYKHLGVAPGKWLGYGATTFPALTEALTDSNNATLAQYETDRLATLLKKLARSIHP